MVQKHLSCLYTHHPLFNYLQNFHEPFRSSTRAHCFLLSLSLALSHCPRYRQHRDDLEGFTRKVLCPFHVQTPADRSRVSRAPIYPRFETIRVSRGARMIPIEGHSKVLCPFRDYPRFPWIQDDPSKDTRRILEGIAVPASPSPRRTAVIRESEGKYGRVTVKNKYGPYEIHELPFNTVIVI